jgi:hypothetical protein
MFTSCFVEVIDGPFEMRLYSSGVPFAHFAGSSKILCPYPRDTASFRITNMYIFYMFLL